MQYKILLSTLALLASCTVGQDTSLATVKNAFNTANIPTDAQINFNPSVLLEVAFPQAAGRPVQVHAGIQLPRNATAIPPTFSVRDRAFLPRQEFVVAMVDLDAPTPQTPTSAQIRHFLGGNFHTVPSLGDQERLVNETQAISNFLQPTPPAGSDPHRYVFLLFEQPNGFNQQTLVTGNTSIANFNISSFASEVGLGNPIGGSFILVGPDPTTA
ncbi:phosphatidylethanolamine-binding protein [Abortiporus biennis]|nr:phosphatidylethanolamine-binding protein [Abortiporus biennis]